MTRVCLCVRASSSFRSFCQRALSVRKPRAHTHEGRREHFRKIIAILRVFQIHILPNHDGQPQEPLTCSLVHVKASIIINF